MSSETLFIPLCFCVGAMIGCFITQFRLEDKMFKLRHNNSNLEWRYKAEKRTNEYGKEKIKAMQDDVNYKNNRIIDLQDEIIKLREELYERQMDVEPKE